MGKKHIKKQNISIVDFPIAKSKSFSYNLNYFIKVLEEKHSSMTSREFVIAVHAFVAKVK
jgi:hypothetical protein